MPATSQFPTASRPQLVRRQFGVSLADPVRRLLFLGACAAFFAMAATTQQQFAELERHSLPASDGSTHCVVMADIDGDGDLDLVYGNGWRDYGIINRLLQNDGMGTFTESVGSLPADADATWEIVLGDVDGDGDLDVVTGNAGHQGQAAPNRIDINLLRQLDAPYALRPGNTYTLNSYMRNGPPALVSVAVPYLSTAPANAAVPGLGVIGIDPMQAVALPPVIITQPQGVASSDFLMPNLPGLVGITVYGQALMLPWPYAARLSNVVADVLQL